MSRIIRSIYTKNDDQEKREIKIRPLFEAPVAEEGAPEHPQVTMQDVLAERDAYLFEARKKIDEEKAHVDTQQQLQRQQLEAEIVAWDEEKPQRIQDAYDEGFAQGYEDGMNKATASMIEELDRANQITVQSQDNAKKYLDDQEAIILQLAMQAAGRILDTVLEDDEEKFADIVRRGLKEAREMKEIKIYVSPKYYDVLTRNRDELAELFPPDVPFLIFVLEELEETECYIETNHGRIVVSVDEQLSELRKKLEEILNSRE